MKEKYIQKKQVVAGGEFSVTIKNKKGEITTDTGWQKNLLLDFALRTNLQFLDINLNQLQLTQAEIDGGAVSNKRALSGTFNQVGNTLTSDGGVAFNDGSFRVGDILKLSSGETALIQVINSPTVVTVFETQNLGPVSATHYRSGHSSGNSISLHNETVRWGSRSVLEDGSLENITRRVDQNFSKSFDDNGVGVMYAEHISEAIQRPFTFEVMYINSCSRIVLENPINVNIGDELIVRYRLTSTMTIESQTNYIISPTQNWPFKTNITSAIADGSIITCTTERNHRHAVGESVELSNMNPVATPASNITSDGSNWTVQVIGHGFQAGDNVVLTSASGNYNGAFTIDSILDQDNLSIVNSSTNAADTGDIRFETPAIYMDGLYTVNTVIDELTFTVLSSLPNTVEEGEGAVSIENANYTLNLMGTDWEFGHGRSSFTNGSTIPTTSNMGLFASPLNTLSSPLPTLTEEVIDITDHQDFIEIPTIRFSQLPNLSNGYVCSRGFTTINALENDFLIRQLYLGPVSSGLNNGRRTTALFRFDHVQRKPNTEELTIEYGIRFLPELN